MSRPESYCPPVAMCEVSRTELGVPAGPGLRLLALQAAALIALLAAQSVGAPLGGSNATIAACCAILLIGLPHGTLDLEIIRREQRVGGVGIGALLILYLGLAAAMFMLWRIAPVTAMAVFVAVAVVHFSEDWQDLGSPFLAQGMAIALLTAPALLHGVQLGQLFVAVAGHGDAVLVAEIMLLVAPTAMAVAAVAIWTMWRSGRTDRAAIGAMIMIGMIVLPPVVGFALFFCLYHSPRHLGLALGRVARSPASRRVIPALTLVALGVAGALFAGQARADLPAQFIAASFMTLSLLTMPHMLVPVIVARVLARPCSPDGCVRPGGTRGS